ncbi:MAG: protein-S-isoprenylcysteine O-methyltransferase Ste14 [Arenicella sp.]|jgi:protein-S-isoprenylcysteine O-methyltransferase Ste14
MHKLENRIPPPIVLLICLIIMPLLAEIGSVSSFDFELRLALASLLVLLGLGIMLTGVVQFSKAKTTIDPLNPEKAEQLVVDGVFSLSRNPMYLGMAIIAVAWTIYLANPWSILGVIAFVLFINRFQITPEERAMDSLFGVQYAQYKASVRRWF